MKGYFEIEGDGGSRVIGQIEAAQERIRQRLAGVRRLVAIGSGKGGVGKSTLTFHVAAALAARGRRVAILDADINGPCQARLAGVRETPPVPGPDGGLLLPAGRSGIAVASLGSLVAEPECVEFDSVSGGASHTWRATREMAFLGQLLGSVHWGALDMLLVDLPPGAERTAQHAELLGAQAAFLLVTVPSELACGVVARSATALARAGNPVLGYVENMSGYWCQECDAVRPLFPAGPAAGLDLPCLGRVPFDPLLAELCDRGESAAAAAGARPAVREIAAIARRIDGEGA